MIRKIIHIDEEKCTGCGICADACHEGAIAIVGGKAKLMRDDYCDGLGDRLPTCPTQAISFVHREAAEYDEAAVQENMRKKKMAYLYGLFTSKLSGSNTWSVCVSVMLSVSGPRIAKLTSLLPLVSIQIPFSSIVPLAGRILGFSTVRPTEPTALHGWVSGALILLRMYTSMAAPSDIARSRRLSA